MMSSADEPEGISKSDIVDLTIFNFFRETKGFSEYPLVSHQDASLSEFVASRKSKRESSGDANYGTLSQVLGVSTRAVSLVMCGRIFTFLL